MSYLVVYGRAHFRITGPTKIVFLDYITDMNLVQYCGAALITGSLVGLCFHKHQTSTRLQLFILIYRENLSERRILRQGATVGSYAVARTFQIRESIALMKVRYCIEVYLTFRKISSATLHSSKTNMQMYSRIVGPIVIFCAPEFVFYPAYTLLSPGTQWDFWRYLSIALYDLWIGMCVIHNSQKPRYSRLSSPDPNTPFFKNLCRSSGVHSTGWTANCAQFAVSTSTSATTAEETKWSPIIFVRLIFMANKFQRTISRVIKSSSSAEASVYFNMLDRDLGRPSLDRY